MKYHFKSFLSITLDNIIVGIFSAPFFYFYFKFYFLNKFDSSFSMESIKYFILFQLLFISFISFFYNIYFLYKKQSTLGMMITGLKIFKKNKNEINFSEKINLYQVTKREMYYFFIFVFFQAILNLFSKIFFNESFNYYLNIIFYIFIILVIITMIFLRTIYLHDYFSNLKVEEKK